MRIDAAVSQWRRSLASIRLTAVCVVAVCWFLISRRLRACCIRCHPHGKMISFRLNGPDEYGPRRRAQP